MLDPDDSNRSRPDAHRGLNQLLAAARDGRDYAFGRLFETFRRHLLLVAHRELPQALRGKVGPSDLVQETAVEAQRGFPGFRGTTAEECFAWLRSILRNNVIDTVRHYEIAQTCNADPEISLAMVAGRRQGGMVELPHGRPDGSPTRREDADALTRALGRLSDDRSTENGPRVHPCGRSNATARNSASGFRRTLAEGVRRGFSNAAYHPRTPLRVANQRRGCPEAG